MKRFLYVIVGLYCALAFAHGQVKDPFVGWYMGTLEGAKGYPLNHQKGIFAEVTRQGKNSYSMRILSGIMSRSEVHAKLANLKAVDEKLVVSGTDASFRLLKAVDEKLVISGTDASFRLKNFSGWATDKAMQFTCMDGSNRLACTLKKIKIESPTLGQKPPSGAVVLFDGKDDSAFVDKDGNPGGWKCDGQKMRAPDVFNEKGRRVGKSIYTKEAFPGAFKLHVEFRLPAVYSPHRVTVGNSGVYIGDYEIQIIDSFGSEGYWDECGALYRQVPPQVNASLEVGAWQTFDIEYTPPKFDGETLLEYPLITVYHNGVCVLRDVPCKAPTNADVYKYRGLLPTDSAALDRKISQPVNMRQNPSAVKIMLQDHAGRVDFANIWLEKISNR